MRRYGIVGDGTLARLRSGQPVGPLVASHAGATLHAVIQADGSCDVQLTTVTGTRGLTSFPAVAGEAIQARRSSDGVIYGRAVCRDAATVEARGADGRSVTAELGPDGFFVLVPHDTHVAHAQLLVARSAAGAECCSAVAPLPQ